MNLLQDRMQLVRVEMLDDVEGENDIERLRPEWERKRIGSSESIAPSIEGTRRDSQGSFRIVDTDDSGPDLSAIANHFPPTAAQVQYASTCQVAGQ